jgi:hypothetical protein
VGEALAAVYAGLPSGAPGTWDVLRSAANLLAGRFTVLPPRDPEQAAATGLACEDHLPLFDSRRCRSREDLMELAARIRRSRNISSGGPARAAG